MANPATKILHKADHFVCPDMIHQKPPYFAIFSFLLCLLSYSAMAQVTQPDALTTASKPVLDPSGAAPSPFASFSSVSSSLKTLGLPDKESLKKQKDAYVSGIVPADLGLKVKKLKEKRARQKSKAKLLKTEYEGLAIVKAYTKVGSGDRTTIEEFHVLRNNDAAKPLPYVREVFHYFQRSGRVTSSIIRDEGTGLLLHGPYKRYQNGDLVEEGFYYAGMRDGRWEKYDGKFMLVDKTHWHQGLLAESNVTYYDSAHQKIKEIIPIDYGRTTGTYMAFHENGLLAEEGKYDNGVKVGRWTQYHPVSAAGGRRMRSRVTQHASNQWDTDFEPFIVTEWDEKGKTTFKYDKKKAIEEDEADN